MAFVSTVPAPEPAAKINGCCRAPARPRLAHACFTPSTDIRKFGRVRGGCQDRPDPCRTAGALQIDSAFRSLQGLRFILRRFARTPPTSHACAGHGSIAPLWATRASALICGMSACPPLYGRTTQSRSYQPPATAERRIRILRGHPGLRSNCQAVEPGERHWEFCARHGCASETDTRGRHDD